MENNIGEKFLPLGSVVILKGGKKRLMVTGFCTMSADDQNTVYDYSGCLYPEGIISSKETALFNHEQIENVFHLGLVDEEEKNFKIKLNEMLNKELEEISTNSVEKTTNINNFTNINDSSVDIPILSQQTNNYQQIETFNIEE